MTPEQERELILAATNLVLILETIVRMSDEVKHAPSPLSQQGKLLYLQQAIQRSAIRVVPHLEAMKRAIATVQKTD